MLHAILQQHQFEVTCGVPSIAEHSVVEGVCNMYSPRGGQSMSDCHICLNYSWLSSLTWVDKPLNPPLTDVGQLMHSNGQVVQDLSTTQHNTHVRTYICTYIHINIATAAQQTHNVIQLYKTTLCQILH